MYFMTRGSLSSRSKSLKSSRVNWRRSMRSVCNHGKIGSETSFWLFIKAVRSRDEKSSLTLIFSCQRRELFRLKFLPKRPHDFVQLSVHDGVDLVERQVDPVIGDASLRKVVRA